ncbi:beta strand repeat-containing protein [Hymenobacter negativus]|uniref:IPT/TIG domain-containing protein n=1 Tax=Hymenobacter negativus TaxID=2795026 RepID=A0ABS3QNY2_9BACT|nr:IPT/TIG domain-containing protein [Hymenobacter negativus]MBO2012786.1 IPT/TIG domain-containing protein [Hymenobacter negativus]
MQTFTRTPFPRRPWPATLLLLLLLLSSAAAWAQPTITGFSPASGASGSNVVITGSGFTGTTSVRFGELSAVFTVNSSTQITAVVPRAASTQLINATTGAGFAFSPSTFAATRASSVSYTLVANNFAGVSGGANAAPAVADLDGDGRLDLLVGRADGTIARYEQTAANGTTFTSLGLLSTGSANLDMGTEATVAIVDLEGNGRFNLVLGRGDGTVSEYEQTGVGAATFALVVNNLSGISTTSNTVPSMTDLDGDGRLELLVGKGDGITSHSQQSFENTDQFYRIDTNFNSLLLPGNAAPFCTDLDGDGLIDILFGVSGGNIYRYEQIAAGSYTISQQSSTFNSISAGTNAKPCVTDIDGDGLLDLLVGRADGTIDRYEQTVAAPAPTISGFSPPSGPVGTTVTVTGTNLAGVTAASVNNVAGTITGTPTATSFTFTVGSGSTTGLVRATTPSGTASSGSNFTVTVPNAAPTDLSLSNASVAENQPLNTSVGTFSSTDPNAGNTFTYTFAVGGADNGSFNIIGSTLTTNGSFDYETRNSYSVKIRTTDQGGLFYEETFTIGVTDVAEVPTVTSFTPTTGPVGTSVAITGTHFNDAGAATVKFNGTTATTVTVNSNSQITASVPAGATTGTISVTNADGTGTSTNSFTVSTVNDLSVTLSATPNPVNEDATLTYTLTVSNAGPSSASGITATLALPAGAVFLSAAGTGWAASQSGGTATATRSTLAVGTAPVLTVQIQAPGEGGTISAMATVSSTTFDPTAANNTATATTTVTGVNDAPVASVPATQTTAEDTPKTFNTAGNNVISVSDADAGSGNVEITLTAANGTFTLSRTTGLTFTVGDGAADAAMTFRGTLASINAALNGLVFTPTLNFNGTASLTLAANDLGNTGTGGAKSDSDIVNITVGSTNDAPVLTATTGSTAWTQGAGPVAVDAGLTVTDTDNATLASASVRLTTGFLSTQDVLAFSNTSITIFGNIGASYAAGTGILSLTSAGATATKAQWQTALRAITYNNTAGTPSTATRTVSFVANDGSAASAAVTKAVTLTLRTATPQVDTPADGSSTSDNTPTYTGSAPAGSTVTVYVDGVSIGTVTANNGNGNWSKTQTTALSEGSHTVYATAQTTGQPVSLNSATNTFTVDTVAPTVVISSSVGPSGSSTSTSPVPFTITFSEGVSNFAIGDVTVTGGTKSALTVVSASQYTFTVTPSSAPSTITVNIAASRAQDDAGNNNSAAAQFTIIYALPPTITALSASAELPGMPVTITGTRFVSGSTVSFGGVAASSVTYNSATSLTATVPVGAAVGSSAVVVTSNGVSSTSGPAFSVLKVYDAVASCLTTTGYTATGDGNWHYLLASNGQVVAALQDTRAALGTVSVQFLVAGTASAVRQDGRAHKYLDRNWRLTATNSTFTGSSVNVRFYGLTTEFSRLQAADAAVTYANLKSTQYSGPNEDCNLSNNAATGESRTLNLTASTPGNGVVWFVAQATVADHFSEFYLTGSTTPLPVELTAFTAEAEGAAARLAWRTASEKNSARFEIERSLDGKTFARIGEVAAQGSKAGATDYAFRDAQTPKSLTLVYYRLRQVDADGTFAYSPMRAVTVGGSGLLTLYPNPARSAVAVTGLVAGNEVEVLDALGSAVAQATADAAGTARLTLPAGLAAGVYVVRSGGQARRLVVE